MSNHVNHLITAYVHRQLPRRQRDRVLQHVRDCAECWDALTREQQLEHDLAATMPFIGQINRAETARMWPVIWNEFRSPKPRSRVQLLPSYSLMLAMFMLIAFAVTALMTGPTQVIAAPFQAAPLHITATATAASTDEPQVIASAEASETANPQNKPMPSPAPMVSMGMFSQIPYNGVSGNN